MCDWTRRFIYLFFMYHSLHFALIFNFLIFNIIKWFLLYLRGMTRDWRVNTMF